MPTPDFDEDFQDEEEFYSSLSESDERRIREALLAQVADIVADKAILTAPPEKRLKYAQLVEIAETDMQHADIEEIIFVLTVFGYDIEITINPNEPADGDDRIIVTALPNGQSYL